MISSHVKHLGINKTKRNIAYPNTTFDRLLSSIISIIYSVVFKYTAREHKNNITQHNV